MFYSVFDVVSLFSLKSELTMTIVITIHTDNAAFQDNGLATELKNVLNTVTDRAYNGDLPNDGQGHRLYDSNGNTVGNLAVIDDDTRLF